MSRREVNTWGMCIRTGEVTVSFLRVSSFSMQHQPGYLKISRVYPRGSMGREVCIGLVVEGDGRRLWSQYELGTGFGSSECRREFMKFRDHCIPRVERAGG